MMSEHPNREIPKASMGMRHGPCAAVNGGPFRFVHFTQPIHADAPLSALLLLCQTPSEGSRLLKEKVRVRRKEIQYKEVSKVSQKVPSGALKELCRVTEGKPAWWRRDRSHSEWERTSWVLCSLPCSFLTDPVILGKSLYTCTPLFLHCKTLNFRRQLWRLNELIHIKCSENITLFYYCLTVWSSFNYISCSKQNTLLNV